MNKKPLWSVVVIARNESKTLPRLLESLDKFDFKKRGGAVVVLDTGSTDSTAEIARDWGAIVEEVGPKFMIKIDKETADAVNAKFVVGEEAPILKEGESLFNFAAARNYAASLSPTNVVSTPDADEIFTALDIDYVNDFIEQGLGQGEFEFVFAHDANGKPAVQFKQCKMYDKTKFEWRGIVHECTFPTTNVDIKRFYLVPEKFKIEHYQNPETNRSGYLRGLALDCFQNPENDRNSHYVGREFLWTGRPRMAIKEFQRHCNMKRWPAEHGQSLCFMGDAYEMIGDEDKAVEAWHRSIFIEGQRREPWMRLAWHYYKKNDAHRAASYSAAAMELPWTDFYSNRMGHYTFEPKEINYWARWMLGDKEGSLKQYKDAVHMFPEHDKFKSDRKFYFEYIDDSIQGWLTPTEQESLYQTSKKYKDSEILEVGSWKGRSTHALLTGGAKITAVDTFQGSDDLGDLTNSLAKKEDIYATFMKNVGEFKNLEVMKMTSEEARKKVGDKKFSSIFIDALHTEEGVKKDIELWKGNATQVLMGHDYDPKTWPGVVRGVDAAMGRKPDRIEGSIWIYYM